MAGKDNFLSEIVEKDKLLSVTWSVKVNLFEEMDLYSDYFSRPNCKSKYRLNLYYHDNKYSIYLYREGLNNEIYSAIKYTSHIVNQENQMILEKCGLIFFDDDLEFQINEINLDDIKTYLDKDILKIHFTVKQILYDNCLIPWKVLEEQVKTDDLVNDLGVMLATNKFSDFVVKMDGKEIKVHKCILASRSSVFSAMLENDFSENKLGYVEITDTDKETISSFIRFLYTSKVTISNVNEAQKLFAAANKYDVSELKHSCEKYILENMDVSNVMELLVFAEFNNAANLKEHAIDYIVENRNSLDESQFDILGEHLSKTLLKKFFKT